MDHSSAICQKF